MSNDVPTDQELIDGDADHDCRLRVRDGRAERVDVYETAVDNIQLVYECDVCERTVYLICEPYNIQIEQLDDDYRGSVLEPGLDADRSEIYEHDGLGPA